VSILCDEDLLPALCALASAAEKEIAVVSAFVTSRGIQPILATVPQNVLRRELHVRWRAQDIVMGVSDLGVYDLAREYRFTLFMQPALHAKFVIGDRRHMILGSANFTGMGLGCDSAQNFEVGYKTEITTTEAINIYSKLSNSVLVTASLYERLSAFLNALNGDRGVSCEYPKEILAELHSGFTGLWVRDLPFQSSPPSLSNRQFAEPPSKSDLELEQRFSASKCIAWLRQILEKNGGEQYFGELASELHNSLLEDPLPYRTEVKRLIENLMNWAVVLIPGEFGSDTPHHSRRLYVRR
jgi:phosphatidylserine/phosphatidylglycerophosphate/cardiolipin synthase-like enzyme